MQYLTLGRLLPGYAVALVVVGLSASLFGQCVLIGYVRRSGRNSLIAFIIATINVVATVLLVVAGGIDVAADVRDREDLGFRPLC